MATGALFLHSASTQGLTAFKERNQTSTALHNRIPEEPSGPRCFLLAEHTLMKPLSA